MNTKNIALSLVAAALLAAVPAAAFADSCAKPVHSACPALKASCERPGHPAPQLSAEQAAELQKLRAEHHAALASLRDSIGQKKMELHALAPNPNVKPEELKALAAEISDLRKQIRTLGEEYRELLLTAKRERWIDVYETENKRSGAYSMGVTGVHPFVLLNHTNTLHDAFTIAHELGHAMHSYYSTKTQPYAKSHYSIFVAEVASTVNEVLLLKYMIKNAKTKEEKQYLLNYYLEMFRTTLFRQTMFAEFEYKVQSSFRYFESEDLPRKPVESGEEE